MSHFNFVFTLLLQLPYMKLQLNPLNRVHMLDVGFQQFVMNQIITKNIGSQLTPF